MNFLKIEKNRLGWATSPIKHLFDDCKIDRIELVNELISIGILKKDVILRTNQYRKRHQIVFLPASKGESLSCFQESTLKFISENKNSFETACKLFLADARRKKKPLLSLNFDITKCVELNFLIIPSTSEQGIKIYFDCDWGNFSSGEISIALSFFNIERIEECELDVQKYGL